MNYNYKQQLAIDGNDKYKVIIAPAGSGKTSTLVGAIDKYYIENPNDHIVAITFTRKASAELKDRIGEKPNIEVSTIHSWSWKRLQELANEFGFKVQLLEDEAIKDILKQLSKNRRQYYLNQFQLFSYVMGNYNIDIDDTAKKIFETIRCDYIKFKKRNLLYDFTDLPEYLLDKLTEFSQRITNIDALFVDEFQDIDPIQLQLFDLVDSKRKCYIGDPRQCQPAGTKVLVRDKGYINIEDIQIGDSLVYYDRAKGYLSGLTSKSSNCIHKKVLQTSCTEYKNDYIIKVMTDEGNSSSYTTGHRTFVKLNELPNKHVVYLMCDNNYRFRVGKIALGHNNGVNSWRSKLKDENCEKIWLLKIFDTDLEARIEEAKISYTYGIPQICWQTDKVQWTKEAIDYIYKDIDIFERSNKCLKDYQRDIRYPLLDFSIDWLANNHFTTNSTCLIYAVNIMEEYMSCLAYGNDSSHRNKHFEKIVSVDRKFIDIPIPVYSLEVEGGTYVADNLVTHNCIYAFRGAVEEVFEKLDNFMFYGLTINYRSYQEILNYASTLRQEGLEAIMDDRIIQLTDIENLSTSEIECIRKDGGNVYNIPFIGQCTNLSNNTKQSDILVIKTLLQNKKTQILCRANKQVKKLQALGIDNVSTIHQAKGLEYDNVILIDFPCDTIEELNIAYVGATRAKNNLCIINFEVLLYIICQEDIKSNKKLF